MTTPNPAVREALRRILWLASRSGPDGVRDVDTIAAAVGLDRDGLSTVDEIVDVWLALLTPADAHAEPVGEVVAGPWIKDRGEWLRLIVGADDADDYCARVWFQGSAYRWSAWAVDDFRQIGRGLHDGVESAKSAADKALRAAGIRLTDTPDGAR